ncbi:MAG TPA: protease modulator HflC [Polyangiaceae bacterium]|nr:protease modulator HflC [Polyangiaceae bacterium]
MKSGIIILIVALVVAGFSSFFIVDETEVAIVTEFGRYKRTAREPGAYFKIPFVEAVHRMESRIMGSDTAPAEYLTLDKKRLVADPVTRWRIVEPLTFYNRVHDQSGAKARLDDIVNSELRRELASHNFGDIVGNEREPLMIKVAEQVRAKTKTFGIQVIDVRIKRADLPREVQESVYQRMRAERDRVAKQYRSEGEEEAAKIRAETDKEKTILLAQAYEKAQKARGEGDAESTRIYAEALGKDPEFFAFVRSLDTYEKAMGEKSSLVLSTGSDLFKYLSDPKKRR